MHPPTQLSNDLVGRDTGEPGKQLYGNSGSRSDSRVQSSRGVVCYYSILDIILRDSKKLQCQNQKSMSAHMAPTNEASNQSNKLSAKELIRFQLYQEYVKFSSTLIATIVK